MIDLSFIPKKYRERVSKIEVGFGLIDNCKYLLYFNDNWSWYDICCVPVKSKKEALEFIKESERKESEV